MEIEFDSAKNISNYEKHGIDFSAAREFDFATALIWQDERRVYGEKRFVALGELDGRVHVMVYTRRGDTVRVISLRKANRRESRRYASES